MTSCLPFLPRALCQRKAWQQKQHSPPFRFSLISLSWSMLCKYCWGEDMIYIICENMIWWWILCDGNMIWWWKYVFLMVLHFSSLLLAHAQAGLKFLNINIVCFYYILYYILYIYCLCINHNNNNLATVYKIVRDFSHLHTTPFNQYILLQSVWLNWQKRRGNTSTQSLTDRHIWSVAIELRSKLLEEDISDSP